MHIFTSIKSETLHRIFRTILIFCTVFLRIFSAVEQRKQWQNSLQKNEQPKDIIRHCNFSLYFELTEVFDLA